MNCLYRKINGNGTIDVTTMAKINGNGNINVTAIGKIVENGNINDFAWQPRFYDHIIRNDASFQRIRDYIENNPKTWKDDTFYCD